MNQTELRSKRNADRAVSLDNLALAEEIKRLASVSARFLSRSEAAETPRERDDWAYSAGRHEDRFLALVDEARIRLEIQEDTELPRYLTLFGATDLVTR